MHAEWFHWRVSILLTSITILIFDGWKSSYRYRQSYVLKSTLSVIICVFGKNINGFKTSIAELKHPSELLFSPFFLLFLNQFTHKLHTDGIFREEEEAWIPETLSDYFTNDSIHTTIHKWYANRTYIVLRFHWSIQNMTWFFFFFFLRFWTTAIYGHTRLRHIEQ